VPGAAEEELIAEGFAAWNTGGWEDWVAAHVDPDVLLVDPPELPDSGTYRGRAAYTKRFKEWTEPLGHFQVEITDVAHGRDATMTAIDVRGEATASGIPMQYEVFNVFRFRDGRISEYRLFLDRKAALSEAGVSEV
jgi:ketosteroid isomerase-like protein